MKPRSQNLDMVALACKAITREAVAGVWVRCQTLEEKRAIPGGTRASGQAGRPELGPGD